MRGPVAVNDLPRDVITFTFLRHPPPSFTPVTFLHRSQPLSALLHLLPHLLQLHQSKPDVPTPSGAAGTLTLLPNKADTTAGKPIHDYTYASVYRVHARLIGLPRVPDPSLRPRSRFLRILKTAKYLYGQTVCVLLSTVS